MNKVKAGMGSKQNPSLTKYISTTISLTAYVKYGHFRMLTDCRTGRGPARTRPAPPHLTVFCKAPFTV